MHLALQIEEADVDTRRAPPEPHRQPRPAGPRCWRAEQPTCRRSKHGTREGSRPPVTGRVTVACFLVITQILKSILGYPASSDVSATQHTRRGAHTIDGTHRKYNARRICETSRHADTRECQCTPVHEPLDYTRASCPHSHLQVPSMPCAYASMRPVAPCSRHDKGPGRCPSNHVHVNGGGSSSPTSGGGSSLGSLVAGAAASPVDAPAFAASACAMSLSCLKSWPRGS